MRRASKHTKRRTILLLSLGLVAAIALAAATIGLGQPSIPDGAVAVVDGVDPGTVSDEEFDRALEQTAARLGLEEVPEQGDPQFDAIRDQAMEGLLLAIWVEGEIEDRGIEITEEDVDAELEQIREGFENQKQFARAVRQAEFCTEEELENDVPPIECEDVQRQGRLIAIQNALIEEFQTEPEISEGDIEGFYESNIESFETPETRTVRQIVNEDRAKVEEAKRRLEGVDIDDEDYERRWRAVAKELSQDQASKDRGGLIEGLVEGQGDPAFDEQVFNAEVGELVGPFETERGFNLVEVVEVSDATTQSLEEASETIRGQLTQVRAQAATQEIQEEFIEKWRTRTFCEEVALVPQCANFVEPDPAPVPGQEEAPTGAAVPGSAPIEPGTATFSVDGSTQAGLPQRPRQIGDPCAPEGEPPDPCGPDELSEPDPATGLPGGLPGGLPDGAVPVGPGGASPGAGGAPPGGGAPPSGGGAPGGP